MQLLQLGALQVQRVEEMIWTVPFEFFFPDLTSSHFDPYMEWLAPRFFSADYRVLVSIHTFLIRTPHHNVLVDTCVGNDKERHYEEWNLLRTDFLSRLKTAGIAPEEVDYVFCTHFHSDHVGWNTRLENGRWVPTFPKAKYLFYRPEFEHFMNLPDDEKQAALLDSVVPIAEAGQAEVVEGDFAIGDHIHLEPTPGHTPGHCSVHLSSPNGDAVITGDMMHTPVQIAEPGWPNRVCADPHLAAETRRDFLNRYADSDTLILGSHFAPPTACRIVSENGSHRPHFIPGD